ncbi:MAG: CAP domain-containing protein [Candidatus Pacebacteria bacterium]|nr:CAP domain-containing protein [Candidatus Paceibacterota bacterium]
MWKLIKFIVSIIILVLILSYFFHIPLSFSRLNGAIESVRALVPEQIVSFFNLGGSSAKNNAGKSGSSPSPSPLGIIPSLQDITQKIFAPTPLRVESGESGALSRSGVISLTNSERKKVGVTALKENALLDIDAEKKMQDLFAKQYFEHISPTGVGPGDLAKSVGYDYILIGENLALGNFKDDQTLLAAWMASQGHRENILQSKYTEIGVSVGKALYQGQETWIAVQEFGLPATSCPEPQASLKSRIDAEKIQIASIEKSLTAKRAEIDATTDDSSYNKEVVEYNALVTDYDALVKATQADILDYNDVVNASNTCRQKASI